MSRRSRYFGRTDEASDGDSWDGDLPHPNPDNFPDSSSDWLWARSVQDSRMPHEIADADARRALDEHNWRMFPSSHEPYLHEIIHEELSALAVVRRRANPLKPRVLSPDIADELRRRNARGESILVLAAAIGAPYQTVRRAICGETWAA